MKGNKQKQKQITISAYEMEVIQKSFVSTLKWLEFYIEKSGYSGNWERQISETIKREDLSQPSEIKKFMETALFALDSVIEDKPNFVFEGLQEKFYSWLAKSGIGVDDCPKELVECLVNICKVLNNEGKEFGEKVDREASESIAKMTPEERRQKFCQTLTAAQRMMEVARARQKNLEGKTYKDVETKNQFSGNPDQGKEIFSQIENKYPANPIGAFSLDEVVQNVKNYPQYWRLDEVLTEIDRFGRTKKQEWLLIRWDARLDDYDQQGKLKFVGNPIYRWESFNALQRFEIKKALNITAEYLTNDEIKWVVKEIKENPRIWRTGTFRGHNSLIHSSAQGNNNNEIGTLIHNWQKFSEAEQAEINEALNISQTPTNQQFRQWIVDNINQHKTEFKPEKIIVLGENNSLEEEIWLIHSSAERKDNGAGGLVFDANTMVKVKDLSEAEKEAIGYKSETGLQNSSTSTTPNNDDDDKGIGKIGIFAIIGVVSVLLIGGVVAVRKSLNKKVKK